MPKLTRSNPGYRKHRGSGQAIVNLNGRDRYLGVYGTKASRSEYDRLIAEWLTAGRRSPAAADDFTVAEVVNRFWSFATGYYRHPDGRPTSELSAIKVPLAVLTKLYGHMPATAFGPLALAAVRDQMVAKGWGRTSINAQVNRVRRVFKWAVSQELVPAAVHQALTTVAGLRVGRSAAKETPPVKPVPDATVTAVLPFVSPTIRAMLELQRLLGCRPGELISMRSGDIDRAASVWVYRPSHHKNSYRGHDREIPIGPKAQSILAPWLKMDPTAYLFSPSEADAALRAARTVKRRTPASCGNVVGSNRKRTPRKSPGAMYTTESYRRAIATGCDKAFPAPDPLGRRADETKAAHAARLTPGQRADLAAWRRAHRFHPHQVRHLRATELRREFGLEGAQAVLGHRTLAATQIYAEKSADTAQRIAAAVG